MLHRAVAQMMAQDRIAELHRAGATRSSGTTWPATPDHTESPTASVASRRSDRATPRRAIGWFLVSVGLRLALSPTRARSAR